MSGSSARSLFSIGRSTNIVIGGQESGQKSGFVLGPWGLTALWNANTIGASSDPKGESRQGRKFRYNSCEGGAPAMATLRKSDFTGRVATKLGGSRAQGEAALNAVLSSVQEALTKGDRVVLTGFGSFSVTQVKARRVKPIRGGQAGTLITVPAHQRVRFTAGQELSSAVRKR